MEWCETCSGTGRISCGACWGGQHKPVCPDCLGNGQDIDGQTCRRCNGTGKITPQSCPFCGNSMPCPVCANV